MENLKANPDLIDEVCDIIGHHHHPRDEETVNFQVVYDADLIVNLEEKQSDNPGSIESLKNLIDNAFLTQSGRDSAKKVLL